LTFQPACDGCDGPTGAMVLHVDGQKLLYVKKDSVIGQVTVEAQDILYPFRLLTVFRYDLEEAGIRIPHATGLLSLETTLHFDKNYAEEDPLYVQIVLKRSTTGYEWNMNTKITTFLHVSIRMLSDIQQNKIHHLLELFHSEEKTWGFEIFHITSDDHNRHVQNDQRITLATPFYSMEYDSHWTRKLTKNSSSANINIFSRGQGTRGIGYMLTSEKINENEERILTISRPSGSKNEGQIVRLGLHTFPGKASTSLELVGPNRNKTFSGKVSH
jgi:hypothetical protein